MVDVQHPSNATPSAETTNRPAPPLMAAMSIARARIRTFITSQRSTDNLSCRREVFWSVLESCPLMGWNNQYLLGCPSAPRLVFCLTSRLSSFTPSWLPFGISFSTGLPCHQFVSTCRFFVSLLTTISLTFQFLKFWHLPIFRLPEKHVVFFLIEMCTHKMFQGVRRHEFFLNGDVRVVKLSCRR